MMARVLDCRRGRDGEQNRDVLVLVGERPVRSLLGEIEISDYTTPSDDRDVEERVHGRVPWGKPAGVGVRGQIGQPDRPGLADDETEDAVATWRGPDVALELRVDPVSSEALEDL